MLKKTKKFFVTTTAVALTAVMVAPSMVFAVETPTEIESSIPHSSYEISSYQVSSEMELRLNQLGFNYDSPERRANRLFSAFSDELSVDTGHLTLVTESLPEEILDISISEITEEELLAENGGYMGIDAHWLNAFSWNSATQPFNAMAQQATNNVDRVFDQFWNGTTTGQAGPFSWSNGLAALRSVNLQNPTNQSVFTTQRNEGHVNDWISWRFYGGHTYLSDNRNGNPFITIFTGNGVRSRVFSINGELLFDSGAGTNGHSRAPGVVSGFFPLFNHGQTQAFGQFADFYLLQVPHGQYFVTFTEYGNSPFWTTGNIDTLDSRFHYAFYTGMPVPVQRSVAPFIAHNNQPNQRATTATMETTSPIINRVTVGGGTHPRSNWMSINRITVEVRTMPANSVNVSNIGFEFRYPGHSGFEVRFMPPSVGTIPVNNVQGVSPIGTWDFRHLTMWRAGNWQTGAITTFSPTSHFHIEFLVPFGTGL